MLFRSIRNSATSFFLYNLGPIVIGAVASIVIYSLFTTVFMKRVIPYLWGFGLLGILWATGLWSVVFIKAGWTYPVNYFVILFFTGYVAPILLITFYFKHIADGKYYPPTARLPDLDEQDSTRVVADTRDNQAKRTIEKPATTTPSALPSSTERTAVEPMRTQPLSSSSQDKFSVSIQADDAQYYLLAQDELENGEQSKALWAKIITLSEGDEEKAKYRYINIRVAELVEEARAAAEVQALEKERATAEVEAKAEAATRAKARANQKARERDRKSTRLNSSHKPISYAVFCLKKKKQTT